MQELQLLLYAESKRSLLINLQAMAAGGNDGTIRHVVGSLNPQGSRLYCFKQPAAEEAADDFFWRVYRQVPSRGDIVIFNRSHDEDVLVARVRKLVPKKLWSQRYRLPNEFEKNLAAGITLPNFSSTAERRVTGTLQTASRRPDPPLEAQHRRILNGNSDPATRKPAKRP